MQNLSFYVTPLISTTRLISTDTKTSFRTLLPLSGPHLDFNALLISETIKAI